jgi:hypothetical protein
VGAVNWGLAGAAMGSVAAIFAERALSLARISSRTEIRVRELQDWTTLAGILAAAILSAGIAAFFIHFTHWPAFVTLAAGGTVLAIAYPGALCLTGQRRCLASFIASIRHTAPHPEPAAE